MVASGRRCIAVILALIMLASAASAQPRKDRLTDGVDRALNFLVSQQEKDGAWTRAGTKHAAVTSLGVLAFLSAGHVPGEGPYRANVEKAIRWVINQQHPSGVFATDQWEEMYSHGISTMMLCEVAAMCDAKTARELKPKIEKAVQVILRGQRTDGTIHRGGWRYRVDANDADLSITGWQILALRAARNLGCDVPAERIDLAMNYVLQCRDARSGGFAYQPGSNLTTACTGTGVLALELYGKGRHHSQEALLAGSYILKNPHNNDMYTLYYCSQAMFQLGNNYWTIFRPALHKTLLDGQQHNGSWLGTPGLGSSFATAMGVLALTVEYRLLPIYQRDEDGDSKKGKMAGAP